MMRAIRKGLALGIAAALFISGLKVTATAEEAIADNAAQVSSVSSGDYSESENLPTVQENAEGEITAYAAEDATSGDFGASNGLHWEWDALTKTITISGDDIPNISCTQNEDYTLNNNVFNENVEYIRFENCTLRNNLTDMFAGLEKLKEIDFSELTMINIESTLRMFRECSSLTSIDLSMLDTSNVRYMEQMFCDCSSLTSLELGYFDTRNVITMMQMFEGCSSLTSLDVSGFDTSNVTNMFEMFCDCNNLESLDLGSFDTGRVEDMAYMFWRCHRLTALDLSHFNAEQVTRMDEMFLECSSLTNIQTPYNISVSAPLPTVSSTMWKDSGGNEVTQLPQGLNYSVMLTRYDAAPGIITTTDDLNMEDVIRVKYVPYSYTVKTNNTDTDNTVTFSVVEGRLAEGLQMYPATGEIYGVPLEAGEFLIKVMASYSNPAYEPSYAELMLTVLENTDENVGTSTDSGYEITERVLNFDRDTIAENSTQTLVSQGEYSQFSDVYIDGQKLTEGQDYTSASGSTRITIYNQTLGNVGTGTHTLGVEFRTEDGVLKRAAQNYTVSSTSGNDNPSGESGNGSTSVTDNGNSNTADSGQDGNAAHVTAEISADTSAEEEKELIIYTVVRGDNLWKIATKYYGRGNDWKIIYEDNREIIRNPDLLYAGQQLRIRISGAGSTSASTAEVISTAGDGVSSYRVQKGESLWAIAHSVYGKGNLWKRIYEANKNVIADPEKIYGGQLLTIPQN